MKYQFFAEIAGANLLDFIRQINLDIVDKIDSVNGFRSYNSYKAYYYKELYLNLKIFERKYYIKRSKVIKMLQNILANFFEKKFQD